MKNLDELTIHYHDAHQRKLKAFRKIEINLHKGNFVSDKNVDGYANRIIDIRQLEEVLEVLEPNGYEKIDDLREELEYEYTTQSA